MNVKEESEKTSLKLNIQKLRSWHLVPLFQANRWGNNGNNDRLFSWAKKITADGDCSYEIKIHLLFGRKAISNLDSILESRDITLSTGPSRQSYGFSSSHVQMQVLNHKES